MEQTTDSNNKQGIEIGLYSIGDHMSDALSGKTISEHQRIKEIVEAAKLADQAGLDIFGIGESHQEYFATSAHSVILGAIATVTKRIRLASTSTIISYSDPVRVYEDFSTLDLLSDGRAEIIAGRGSRAGGYHLFGYDLNDYDALFDEKMQMLLHINENERINWSGQFRPPLRDAEIFPKPFNKRLPIWTAVGGTPESAARAGILGTPMALAALGGSAAYFKSSVDIYRRAGAQAGHNPADLKVAVTNIMHIAKNSQQAMDEFYPYYSHVFEVTRGTRVPRGQFDHAASAESVLLVGSPQQIVEKILHEHEVMGLKRVLCQIDIGGMPYDKIANTIELLATEVAPAVRRATSK